MILSYGKAQPQTMDLRFYTYGYNEDETRPFKEYIRKKYGISLNFIITKTEDEMEKYKAAKEKKADILNLTHCDFQCELWPFIQENLLLPLDLAKIPNYSNVFPFFKKNPEVVRDKKVYGTPLSVGLYALGYNADIIKEEPTSWSILWDEEYKNKYSISANDPQCNLFITALMLGAKTEWLTDIDTLFQRIPINSVRPKLNELVHNAASLWHTQPGIEELKNLALVTTWGESVMEAQKNGMNWKFASPKEGSAAWFDHFAITAAVTPDTLKYKICLEWLNYSLSSEFQSKAYVDWGTIPVITSLLSRSSQNSYLNNKLDDEKFWKTLAFDSINEADDYRVIHALWKFALNERLTRSGDETGTANKPEMNSVQSTKDARKEGADRFDLHAVYQRGKRLALERKKLLSTSQEPLSIFLPPELQYDLTLKSIELEKTKQELIIKALQDYLNKEKVKSKE